MTKEFKGLCSYKKLGGFTDLDFRVFYILQTYVNGTLPGILPFIDSHVGFARM